MHYIPTKEEMKAIDNGDEKMMFKIANIFLKEGRLNFGTYFLRRAAIKHYQPAVDKLAIMRGELEDWGWGFGLEKPIER